MKAKTKSPTPTPTPIQTPTTKTITLRRAAELSQQWGLNERLSRVRGKAAFAVVSGLSQLEPGLAALTATSKPSPEFTAYDQTRLDKCRSLALKDPETGEPVTKNGQFVFASPEAALAELDALAEAYSEVIADRRVVIAEVEELLDSETITYTPGRVRASDLESLDLTGDIIHLILQTCEVV